MINKKDGQQRGLDEIHEIMFLLRGDNATKDGDYRSVHLGTVLEYLKNQLTESKATTLQKLALILGMSQRQIRENYFDGLLAFGVVSLSSDCNTWKWIGVSAIKNKYGMLRKNNSEDNKFVVDSIVQHAKENPNGVDKYQP